MKNIADFSWQRLIGNFRYGFINRDIIFINNLTLNRRMNIKELSKHTLITVHKKAYNINHENMEPKKCRKYLCHQFNRICTFIVFNIVEVLVQRWWSSYVHISQPIVYDIIVFLDTNLPGTTFLGYRAVALSWVSVTSWHLLSFMRDLILSWKKTWEARSGDYGGWQTWGMSLIKSLHTFLVRNAITTERTDNYHAFTLSSYSVTSGFTLHTSSDTAPRHIILNYEIKPYMFKLLPKSVQVVRATRRLSALSTTIRPWGDTIWFA